MRTVDAGVQESNHDARLAQQLLWQPVEPRNAALFDLEILREVAAPAERPRDVVGINRVEDRPLTNLRKQRGQGAGRRGRVNGASVGEPDKADSIELCVVGQRQAEFAERGLQGLAGYARSDTREQLAG
ncbi:MAG: hypothetical protein ACYS22_20370, partial [Planctomycetota bacterium]